MLLLLKVLDIEENIISAFPVEDKLLIKGNGIYPMSKNRIVIIILAFILIAELILLFVQDLKWSQRTGVEVEEKIDVQKKIKLPLVNINGSDLQDVPRFPGSVRTSYLKIEYEIMINYSTEDKQEDVIKYYSYKMSDFWLEKRKCL